MDANATNCQDTPSGTNYCDEVTLTNVVGLIASSLSIAFVWPQVLRVYAKRSTEGVVPESFLQGSCGSLLWTIYGFGLGNLSLIIANVQIVIASALILMVCVRHEKIALWKPVVAHFATLVLGLFALSISINLLGLVTVAVGTPAIIWQVVRVYRTEHLYGVSVMMYGLLFACTIAWFSYGVLIGDWFVASPNIIGISGSLYIYIRVLRSHQKFKVPDEPLMEII